MEGVFRVFSRRAPSTLWLHCANRLIHVPVPFLCSRTQGHKLAAINRGKEGLFFLKDLPLLIGPIESWECIRRASSRGVKGTGDGDREDVHDVKLLNHNVARTKRQFYIRFVQVEKERL